MEWNKIAEDFDISFVENNTVAVVSIDRAKKYNAMAYTHFQGMEAIFTALNK